MPLFHIQDNDRPCFVQAKSYGAAVDRWREYIAADNECELDQVELPLGVTFVAEDDDVILDV